MGLLHGIYRLWSRVRQIVVRKWQWHRVRDACINMQAQRHVGDAAWRARMRATLSHFRKHTVIEAMWDLRMCFEHVQHKRLVQEAYAAGYPMDLLRVSMVSYTWPRTILTDAGVAAPALSPSRGIVAVSAFATFELTAYLIAAMRALVGRAPRGLHLPARR